MQNGGRDSLRTRPPVGVARGCLCPSLASHPAHAMAQGYAAVVCWLQLTAHVRPAASSSRRDGRDLLYTTILRFAIDELSCCSETLRAEVATFDQVLLVYRRFLLEDQLPLIGLTCAPQRGHSSDETCRNVSPCWGAIEPPTAACHLNTLPACIVVLFHIQSLC